MTLAHPRHTVAVMCAHQHEFSAVRDALVEHRAERDPDNTIGYVLPLDPAGNATVRVLLGFCDQGNDKALDATNELLAHPTGPRVALFVGTCAGLKSDVAVGDVFAVEEVNYILTKDSDRIRDDYKFVADRGLVTRARHDGLLVGVAVSYNDLLTSENALSVIVDKYPRAHLYDMESGGFMKAVAAHPGVAGLPLRSVMDKVLDRSDVAKDANQRTACRNAALAAVQIITAYAREESVDPGAARKLIAYRTAGDHESNAEGLIRHIVEAVTGDANQQTHVRSGFVDILFPGGVIEVEPDLRVRLKPGQGREQVSRYMDDTGVITGYVTDGVLWQHFQETSSGRQQVGTFEVKDTETALGDLIQWLELGLTPGVIKVAPTPEAIERRLGSKSPARLSDRVVLASLWGDLEDDSETKLKRELWARSLRTALGTQFTDAVDLFLDHTYMVALAELIANKVVGVDIAAADPSALMTGAQLGTTRLIYGVVESDFFDWFLAHEQGAAFVRRLARRVDQFDWDAVEHDILKHLYEAIIGPETRKALGEYYTPDWLASQVIDAVVDQPLGRTVLDPSCGSGTFLFHAVRKHLTAAEDAGMSVPDAVDSVTAHVMGFDLHPVAVSLARVTYLLAIGTTRLSAKGRRAVHIPVFLADSLRWDVADDDLLLDGDLEIRAGDDEVGHGGAQPAMFEETFRFPSELVARVNDFENFLVHVDKKVAKGSITDREVDGLLSKFGVTDAEDRRNVTNSIRLMAHLVSERRDGIWNYYIRNQARPAWVARAGQGVDYLVGNPPWLRYAVMTGDMQRKFKAMMQARSMWTGGKVAQAEDLSALFVARATELYLKTGGGFGFVLPEAMLRAKQYAGFRSGKWTAVSGKGRNQVTLGEVFVAFGTPWDCGSLAASFPFPSSVAVGHRVGVADGPMGGVMRKLRDTTGSSTELARTDSAAAEMRSPYAKAFRQGATLVPRVLCFAEVADPEPGAPANMRTVSSARSSLENEPWKSLPGLQGTVDEDYIYPVHLGSTILPFRELATASAVLPIESGVVNPEASIGPWWDDANEAWDSHKTDKDSKSLTERWDFHRGLSTQLVGGGLRVVYTASGNKVAAAVVPDSIVIEHKLYWAAVASDAEGHYLSAILNSETVRARTEIYQSQGLMGPRDFDKYVFVNPIPTFDQTDPQHTAIAQLGANAAELARRVSIPDGLGFQKSRALVRRALDSSGLSMKIDAAVAELLDKQP